LVTPALGTPSSATLTNATGLPLTSGVTGTLPVANGGTGITSLGTGVATFLGTPSSSNLAAAVTDETGTGALVFANSPTLVTPTLGTPASATLTNATGLPLSTGVTGTLPIANGGTSATTAAGARTALLPSFTGNGGKVVAVNSGATDIEYITVAGTGTVTSVGGTGTVNGITLSGTVTTSGNLTLGGTLSGVDLTTQVTGTLPVGNGGTGATSLTLNNVLLGNGTSAVQAVAPGTTGNVLTSNGTTWQSTAPAVTLAGAETLTNKNIPARVVVISDATSITINGDTTDIATQANTQSAGTLTINAPTGTPFNGQKIILRLLSTNVQTFSWNAAFAGSTDVPLPTASTGSSKYDYVGFMYNSTAAKWQIIAKNFGF
jgi:hypothetical protein